MNALEITKFAASTIVGIGTSKVVSSIIRNNVHAKTLIDTISIAAATYVIGSMAAEATKKYVDVKIDAAVAWYKSTKEQTN